MTARDDALSGVDASRIPVEARQRPQTRSSVAPGLLAEKRRVHTEDLAKVVTPLV